jgi:hypothetical protein
MSKEIKTKKGNVYSFHKTTRDVNGNPRYIVSFLSLGLKTFAPTTETKKAGLKIYRGKSFGGGFIFESFNIQATAEFFDECGLGRPDPTFKTRAKKQVSKQEIENTIAGVLCRRKHFALIRSNHATDEMAADIVEKLIEDGLLK